MSPEAHNQIIKDLIKATMPDGSPISSKAKAEAILAHLGITDYPPLLVYLLGVGVGFRQRARRK